MSEKRRYPRHQCKIKTKFEYWENSPETTDQKIQASNKAKGLILNISQEGIFIICDERVSVGMPIQLQFKICKNKNDIHGTIVRTGYLEDNPSEIARELAVFSTEGDVYIAVVFDQPLPELKADDLLKCN